MGNIYTEKYLAYKAEKDRTIKKVKEWREVRETLKRLRLKNIT